MHEIREGSDEKTRTLIETPEYNKKVLKRVTKTITKTSRFLTVKEAVAKALRTEKPHIVKRIGVDKSEYYGVSDNLAFTVEDGKILPIFVRYDEWVEGVIGDSSAWCVVVVSKSKLETWKNFDIREYKTERDKKKLADRRIR